MKNVPMRQVTLVTYDDCRYDYCKIVQDDLIFPFTRTGNGGKITDVILTEQNLTGAQVIRNDTGEFENVMISSVPVGEYTLYDEDGYKVNPLFSHAAAILKRLDIVDISEQLHRPMSGKEAQSLFFEIFGKNIILPQSQTISMVTILKALLEAFDMSSNGNIFDNAEANGFLKSLKTGKAIWFGEKTKQFAAIGLYREMIYEDMLFCFDEAAGLLFNFFLVENKTCNLLHRFVREKEGFVQKLTETYERALVYPYYEAFGFEIKKRVFHDDLNREISSLYLPGLNLNHPYINEYVTADDEHYILCAAYDNYIRKGGRGIPVIYRASDGKTIQLHDRLNMRAFGMLVTKKNVVYFIADDKIYSYDIKTEQKSIVFVEPDGHELQEIPTISEDGRYLVFFYGTIRNYHPNRGCVLNTETGEWKIFLSEEWVEEHFKGTQNPFAGHFIINPIRTNLVNFLHGGAKNVIDRMWLADLNTGDIWEPYVQILKKDGTFGENLTHWVWSADGKRLYFIRLNVGYSIVENGISYIDLDEQPVQVHVVDSSHSYAHAVPDKDDKYYIADTHDYENGHYKSSIILLNGRTQNSTILFRLSILKNHPSHPHPQFSVSGNQIIFAFTPDDLGRVCVGVVNIEEYRRQL